MNNVAMLVCFVSPGSYDCQGKRRKPGQSDVITQQQRRWDASGLGGCQNPLVAVTLSLTPGLPLIFIVYT